MKIMELIGLLPVRSMANRNVPKMEIKSVFLWIGFHVCMCVCVCRSFGMAMIVWLAHGVDSM